MLGWARRRAKQVRDTMALPPSARAARDRDREGPRQVDFGARAAVDACAGWLATAQDRSTTSDGGVARHYSLVSGWGASYPETTGYIVPTVCDLARLGKSPERLSRARGMLDWLVSIQLESGAFQGGKVDSLPVVPVTFNTGQILLGLARGVVEFGEYQESMRRAADWLVATQDPDGAWRRFPTPFARPGEKAYETHVAWGLIEAARCEAGRGYEQAALANVSWALGQQRENGWVASCCLSDPSRPLTHTLGYWLRGVLEAYRFFERPGFLEAACCTADSLVGVLGNDGFLAGRFEEDWTPAVRWACLTGSVQIAHCWLLLHQITGNPVYRDAGYRANAFVRRTIQIEGEEGVRGGVQGSFPIDGEYGKFEYLNWAAKFFVDSQLLELQVRGEIVGG